MSVPTNCMTPKGLIKAHAIYSLAGHRPREGAYQNSSHILGGAPTPGAYQSSTHILPGRAPKGYQSSSHILHGGAPAQRGGVSKLKPYPPWRGPQKGISKLMPYPFRRGPGPERNRIKAQDISSLAGPRPQKPIKAQATSCGNLDIFTYFIRLLSRPNCKKAGRNTCFNLSLTIRA